MVVDGALDGLFRDGEIEVTGAVDCEKGLAELRAYLPVGLESIDVDLGNSAAKVAIDILDVLRFLIVDITRKVEVELVLLYLLDADHTGVFRNLKLPGEDIDDLVQVHIAQAVLGPLFHESSTGVDHEYAFAGMGILLVDDDDAGWNACAVEEVWRQADDPLDVPAPDEFATYIGLCVATEQHAVRQNAGTLAGTFERADYVQKVGVVALFGGRNAEMAESVMRIFKRIFYPLAPALVAEGWIGNHVIEGLEVALFRHEQWIGQRVPLLDLCCRVVMQDHVHAGKTGGSGILLLTVKRHALRNFVSDLQEKRSRAAGGVIDGGIAGCPGVANADDLRHDSADLGGCVELPFAFAAFGGEMAHQIFIGVAENIVALCPVSGKIECRVLEDGDQVG